MSISPKAAQRFFSGHPVLAFFIAPLLPVVVFFGYGLTRGASLETELISLVLLLVLAYLIATIVGLPILGVLRLLRNRSALVYGLIGFCIGLFVGHLFLSYYASNSVSNAGPGYEDTYWDRYDFSYSFFAFCGFVGAATTSLFWWIAFKVKRQNGRASQSSQSQLSEQEKNP